MHLSALLLSRDASEPIFSVLAGTITGCNSRKVLAGTDFVYEETSTISPPKHPEISKIIALIPTVIINIASCNVMFNC